MSFKKLYAGLMTIFVGHESRRDSLKEIIYRKFGVEINIEVDTSIKNNSQEFLIIQGNGKSEKTIGFCYLLERMKKLLK